VKEKGKGREAAWDVDDDEGIIGGSVERHYKRRRISEGVVAEGSDDGEEEADFSRMETEDDSDATTTNATNTTNASISTLPPCTTTSAQPSPFLVPALPASALKKRGLATVDPDAPLPSTSKKAGRPSYALHPENQAASKFMEQEEWRKAHTSASGTFIQDYYKQSR